MFFKGSFFIIWKQFLHFLRIAWLLAIVAFKTTIVLLRESYLVNIDIVANRNRSRLAGCRRWRWIKASNIVFRNIVGRVQAAITKKFYSCVWFLFPQIPFMDTVRIVVKMTSLKQSHILVVTCHDAKRRHLGNFMNDLSKKSYYDNIITIINIHKFGNLIRNQYVLYVCTVFHFYDIPFECNVPIDWMTVYQCYGKFS